MVDGISFYVLVNCQLPLMPPTCPFPVKGCSSLTSFSYHIGFSSLATPYYGDGGIRHC